MGSRHVASSAGAGAARNTLPSLFFEIQTSHQTGNARLTRRLGGIVYTLIWVRDWHGERNQVRWSHL